MTFTGWLRNEEIRDLYRQARAVLMPGVEDFGMVPVEAQACGAPVVALAEGGAKETVVDGETGVLVEDRSPDAFAEGLRRLQSATFDPAALRASALRFSRERFQRNFKAAVDEALVDERMAPGAERAFRDAARMPPGGESALRENEQ